MFSTATFGPPQLLAWSGLPVSFCVSMHGSVQSKHRDATCWDCFSSHSQPTVLRQIALLLGPDISGRLRLAKEPSETKGERNCPVSLSRLRVHLVRPAFRPELLIVSLGEVVVAQAVGRGYICVMWIRPHTQLNAFTHVDSDTNAVVPWSNKWASWL